MGLRELIGFLCSESSCASNATKAICHTDHCQTFGKTPKKVPMFLRITMWFKQRQKSSSVVSS